MTAEEFLKNRKNIHDKTISDSERIMDFWEIAEIMQEYADYKQTNINKLTFSEWQRDFIVKEKNNIFWHVDDIRLSFDEMKLKYKEYKENNVKGINESFEINNNE